MDRVRARVLVTNDDGIEADGLRALVRAAERAFTEVVVAAPRLEQSGASHALTLRRPVHVETVRPGWHSIDGTPADCVNLAVFRILDGPPDLVLSGINRGYNLGEDVTYSGTVAGALEGRLLGAPAIAVSCPHDATGAVFAHAAAVGMKLAREVLARGLPLDAFLNVNVPPGATGFRVTRQGRRAAREGLEATPAPGGENVYWVGLAPSDWLQEPGADHSAVADGLVSVTPLHADLTFHRALPILEAWGLPGGPDVPPRAADPRGLGAAGSVGHGRGADWRRRGRRARGRGKRRRRTPERRCGRRAGRAGPRRAPGRRYGRRREGLMRARDAFLPARLRLVERLRGQGIADARVLDAIGAIPRERFVPEALRGQAYEDVRLPIGLGQTISAPWTVARMSELLAAPKGSKVLEIGTGSGYQAAVLAAMGLIVFSVERHADLARTAAERLRAMGLLNVSVHHFDGTYGWAAWAPYRSIIVTAAGPEIPATLVKQLDDGGRLVMPLVRDGQQRLVVASRGLAGVLATQDHGAADFVPLVGRYGFPQ